MTFESADFYEMQSDGWTILGLIYKREFATWYSQVSPDRDVFCGFWPDDRRIEIWIRERAVETSEDRVSERHERRGRARNEPEKP